MSENINELLCNFEDNELSDKTPAIIRQLAQGNWEELLKSDVCSKLFKTIVFKNDDKIDTFCYGLASILTFIQANYTGPPLSQSLVEYLEKATFDNLPLDEDEINVNVKHIELLSFAKRVFQYCRLSNELINDWWYLRYTMVHQSLLDECCETLYKNAEKIISNLTEYDIEDNRLNASLQFEIAQVYMMYGRVNDAEKHVGVGRELLGLTFELSGELGKRTKYQQKEVAQIILKVKAQNDAEQKEYVVPGIVKLDDDVRLDKIEYSDDHVVPKLSNIKQVSLVASVQLMQRSRPKDELLLEESEAYLTFILQQNNTWPLRVTTLLLRCRLESNHKRTIERSLMQCEAIVADLNKVEPANVDRTCLFWCLNVQPKWCTESQLADLMLNLGLVKASLDVYLRLHLWEEVIVCYTVLQLRHKAEEVIRQQLEVKETVKLWCLLGDATDDVTHYEKAWELSKHKSARAQRHWGQYLFAKKEYEACIPHLRKSLEINSLQNIVWLRLGYAALSIDNWKLAASCYRRYTTLEPGTFEAWNNLAKAYIKLGEKTRAHFALQEALKYSFDNWKVWDNFMVVSADIAHFDDVIRAYHKVLDLKEKHLDHEVLIVLVRYLVTKLGSESENMRLLTKSRELLGRLTSLYPNDSKLWDIYSELAPTPELKSQRLYRAYRGLVQNDWSKDPVQSDKVLDVCIRLGKTSLLADASSLSNARLTLRAAVAAAKKQSWEQNADKVIETEKILEEIINKK